MALDDVVDEGTSFYGRLLQAVHALLTDYGFRSVGYSGASYEISRCFCFQDVAKEMCVCLCMKVERRRLGGRSLFFLVEGETKTD